MLRFVCLIGALFAFGWATQSAAQTAQTGVLNPSTLAGQTAVRSNEGGLILQSHANGSDVWIGTNRTTINRAERVVLALNVRNLGQAPITVRPRDMRVTTETGAAMRVYTARDLEREARRRTGANDYADNALSRSNALAGASAAGPVTLQQGVPSNAQGANNQSAAALESQRAAARDALANAADSAQQARQAPAGPEFEEREIAPGQAYLTRLTLAQLPEGANTIHIELDVAGEKHTVEFLVAPPAP